MSDYTNIRRLAAELLKDKSQPSATPEGLLVELARANQPSTTTQKAFTELMLLADEEHRPDERLSRLRADLEALIAEMNLSDEQRRARAALIYSVF